MDFKAIARHANVVANDCISAIDAGGYSVAANLAIGAIRETCKLQATAPKHLAPNLYAIRILLNGLRDLGNLHLSKEHRTWLKTPLAVEIAWQLAHDARERLLFRHDLGTDFQAYCARPINEVIEAIKRQYGDGLYNSWEVEIRRLECTVCGVDVRKCPHMPGEWYDGVLCLQRVSDLVPVALSVVENPRDPRCRIWPWQVEEKKSVIHDVPIFIPFDPAGNEDGGKVLEKSTIFPTVRSTLRQPHSSVRYDVYAYRKLKRRELIDTVRQCIVQHKLTPKANSRIRFYTLVGSQYWDRRVASEKQYAESA